MKEEKEVFRSFSTKIKGLRHTVKVSKEEIEMMGKLYKENPEKWQAPDSFDLLIAALDKLKENSQEQE